VNTNQLRDAWHLYRCSYGTPTTMFGRSPVWAQNPDHVAALEAAHLAAGYVPTVGGYIGSKRRCPNGIGGRICQDNGDGCSTHNYGIGWDVEYNLNPNLKRRIRPDELQRLYEQGVTKYSPAIVDVILAVENTDGERLFTWLGYTIGDLMHWQLNVPPERQTVDWGTIMEPAPNITECEPWQTVSWQKAYDTNPRLINDDTHPQAVLTKGDLMVFFDRMGFFTKGDSQ